MRQFTITVFTLVLSGCASIMHGTKQDVGISSSPTGARVVIDGGPPATTPYVANPSRKDNHFVRIMMDGYAPADLTLTKTVSGWVWGNVAFGGLIGLAVDAISGALYNLTPTQLQTALSREVGATVAPTRDGIYVVLVRVPQPEWVKVGQLQPQAQAVEN